ncbi:heavy-metal-associated domain-containing protein, partial [Bacteroidota bacterium]
NAAIDGKKKTKKVVFNVSMDCQSCVSKVEKNIAFEKGVKDLKVNLENKTVEVTYEIAKTDDKKLMQAFKKIGFTSSVAANEVIAKDAACCEGMKEGVAGCEDMKTGAACCEDTKTVEVKKIKK